MTTTTYPQIVTTILCAAALGGFAPITRADTSAAVTASVKKLAPGVILTQEVDPQTPLLVDIVTVDLTAPGVRAEVGVAQDHIGGSDPTQGREDVSRYARRHHALVAVNGDFFPYTGDPLGIGIHNGELFSEPWMGNGKGGPREVLGILPEEHRAVIDKLDYHGVLVPAASGQNAYITVHGVDRVVGKNEIVVITPLFRGAKANRPGGTDVVLTGVNLPLKANKVMRGTVTEIKTTADGLDSVPDGGVILAGGPGKGAAALTSALHPGDAVEFELGIHTLGDDPDVKVADASAGSLPSRSGASGRSAVLWSRISEALGGGPRLLTNGSIDIDSAADGFDPSFVDFPNPRTAVGLSADGHRLIIATVDGRQSISRGVSLHDLAVILKRHGAVDAINLDGGGSTVMAVAGLTVDSPGGAGFERPVADMLVVSSDQPSVAIPDWDPAGRPPQAPASSVGINMVVDKQAIEEGETTRIVLKDGSATIDPARVIWQGPVGRVAAAARPSVVSAGHAAPLPPTPPVDPGPIGFVDQRGNFTALHAGDGVMTALYQGRLMTATITVEPKPAAVDVAAIRAALSPNPNIAGKSILAVHVEKADGTPVTGASLLISVSGGVADNTVIVTDADGSGSVGIKWMSGSGGLVTIGPNPAAGANAGLPTLLSVTVGQ